MSDETKICPFCAETIKAEAIVCRFCGCSLVAEVAAQPQRKSIVGVLILAIIGVCVVFLAIALLTPKKATPPMTTDESVWYACTMIIEEQLKMSMGDAQRYSPSRVTKLADGRYAAKILYAKYSSTYVCDVRSVDGNWQLMKLYSE